MERFLRISDKTCEILSVVFLVTLSVLLILQVIFRNVFSYGPAWLEEIARLVFVMLVFLMQPILNRENLQIKIDFVIDALPKNLQRGMRFVLLCLCIVFGIIFLYSCGLTALHTGTLRMTGTNMPNMVLYVPIFIGMTLFVLTLLSSLFTQFGKTQNDGGR